MANGTMHGEDTSCKNNGDYCLRLYTFYHDGTRGRDSYKTALAKHKAPKYGEWVDFTHTITFTEEELSPDNPYLTMRMYNIGTSIIQF